MKYFDIVTDVGSTSSCATCCCEDVQGVPGTTDLWRLNYAPWVVPMGGKGLSRQFSSTVKLLHKSPTNENTVEAKNLTFKTMSVNPKTIDLTTAVTSADPDLTFEIVPGYEAKSGRLEINDGIVTYTPINKVVGFDTFMYRVTDSNRQTAVGEVFIELVRTQGEETEVTETSKSSDVVKIPRSRVNVINAAAMIDLAVEIHPTANVGDIYRVTLRANALDCDANCFPHESCYDLKIGKC